jgi:hypothetical protein
MLLIGFTKTKFAGVMVSDEELHLSQTLCKMLEEVQ